MKGILFDMDGVLVDSELYMCQAAILMFKELGVVAVPEDFRSFVGMGENAYLGGVAESHGIKVDIDIVKERTYQIFEIIVKDNLSPLPGALEFVNSCRNKGLKMALATSADRVKMEVNLKEIGLSNETFHAIITGQDVVKKKPFPDIYIQAAKSLGLEPAECLVVEDAISGIKAAKAAGCKCLAVTTSFNASALYEADWICSSLSEVPAEAIEW